MAYERQRDIGARIKELRLAQRPRLTQARFAEAIGVTQRAAQEWEAGGGISWENLEKIAALFGVSEGYILEGEEDIGRDTAEPTEAADEIEDLKQVLAEIKSGQEAIVNHLKDLQAAVAAQGHLTQLANDDADAATEQPPAEDDQTPPTAQ